MARGEKLKGWKKIIKFIANKQRTHGFSLSLSLLNTLECQPFGHSVAVQERMTYKEINLTGKNTIPNLKVLLLSFFLATLLSYH